MTVEVQYLEHMCRAVRTAKSGTDPEVCRMDVEELGSIALLTESADIRAGAIGALREAARRPVTRAYALQALGRLTPAE